MVCAVDEIAYEYDYESIIKRIKLLSPALSYLPSEYELYVEFNKSAVENNILHQLSWMALSVTLPDEYEDFLDYKPVNEGDIEVDGKSDFEYMLEH